MDRAMEDYYDYAPQAGDEAFLGYFRRNAAPPGFTRNHAPNRFRSRAAGKQGLQALFSETEQLRYAQPQPWEGASYLNGITVGAASAVERCGCKKLK